MNKADTHTINICAYKGYLICTVNNTPKLIPTGIGSVLSNFNKKDVQISNEALIILRGNIIAPIITKDVIGLKIFSKSKIYWSSKGNIIVHKNDIAVYDIPVHTIVDNIIDSKIKEQLDKL